MMAGLTPVAHAQLPAAPAAAPAALPAAAAPATTAAPAAAPSNIWSFFCMTPDQKAACKQKLCNSAIGQLLNNGLTPASAMTGGIVPTLCPAVSPADLAKPADSAEGAAARIKADEADAKARRAAVRLLGLQDCHYWPEAQLALINALRADRNECVRMEAALAFNNGCCCSKAVIKALVICVSGSEEDGNPSESSPRVRAMAEAALQHCLACYAEVIPAPPLGDGKTEPKAPGAPGGEQAPPPKVLQTPAAMPNKLPNVGQAPVQPLEYYKGIERVSRQEVVEDGRRALARGVPHQQPVVIEQPSSSHSLSDIIRHAMNTGPATPTSMPTTVIVDKNVQPIPVVASPAPPLAPTPNTPVFGTVPLAPTTSAPTLPATKTVVPAATSTVTPPAPVTKTVVPAATSTVTPPASVVPAASKPAPTATTGSAIQQTTSPSTTYSGIQQTSASTTASNTSTTMSPYETPRRSTSYQATTFVPSQPVTAPAAAKLAPATAQPGLASSTIPTPSQVMVQLATSPRAEQRIWAAKALSTCDGLTNPEVMQSLIRAAKTDSDAGVRAACVHCIGQMNVCTTSVLTAVQEMRIDRDPQVRAEVDQCLRQLGEASTMRIR
jgi:HEAT repeat protein